MTIRLITLGALRVEGDDGELAHLPAQRLRVALLVHLAIERRASRAAVAASFWPESTEARARAALRQSLYHLRGLVGPGCLEGQGHEVRAGDRLRADVHAFTDALGRGDAESAARLYGGPFLDGVHLLDQEVWERWVDARRTAFARDFRRACREWLAGCRATGDLAGALTAAQHWVAPDPMDDEAQHNLIETLADAGERAEAIKQYEAYARLLQPEGLRPLDETESLLDRIRATAQRWPDARDGNRPGPSPSPGPRASPDRGPSPRPSPGPRTGPLSVAGVLSLLLVAAWVARPG